MDWTTIVPTAITGAVGLAGIGGTIISARMTGRLEDKRARVSERRRIYANYIAQVTNTFNAVIPMTSERNYSSEEREVIVREWLEAGASAASAASEVSLIASATVNDAAIETYALLMDLGREMQLDRWRQTINKLVP